MFQTNSHKKKQDDDLHARDHWSVWCPTKDRCASLHKYDKVLPNMISNFNSEQLTPLYPTQPPWAPDWEGARGRDHSFPRFWVRSSVWYDAPGLAQGGLKTFNQTHLFSTTYKAMNMLGLNPNEQEVIDIPNHVARLRQFFSHRMGSKGQNATFYVTK